MLLLIECLTLQVFFWLKRMLKLLSFHVKIFDMMQNFMQHIFWKNTVLDDVIVLGWMLFVWLLLKFFKKYIILLLQKKPVKQKINLMTR